LDKIITAIMSSESDKELDNLNTELGKLSEALQKARNSLEPILSAFDFQKHSLGLIHLMHAVCSGGGKFDKGNFIKQAHGLLTHGSIKQIRMEPKKFATICRKFVDTCREVRQPMYAIKPLRAAIGKVAPSEHLTPQHSCFSRMYSRKMLQSCSSNAR